MADSEELTTKQAALIAALLEQDTIGDAAKAAGVASRTAFRWLQDPTFQREYRLARRQLVQHAMATIQRATGEAVQTLRRNLNAPSRAVQVQAAKALLDFAVRAVEVDDLAERMEEVEAALSELNPGAPARRRFRSVS